MSLCIQMTLFHRLQFVGLGKKIFSFVYYNYDEKDRIHPS